MFDLSTWAERVEGKIDDLSDDLVDHEHKNYATIAYVWGALIAIATLAVGLVQIL